jgi:hypothetical protein
VQFGLGGFVHFRQIYYTREFDFLWSELLNMVRAILVFSLVSISLFVIGCGSPAPANNAPANNAAAPPANSNNVLQTTTPAPESTTNNAPTLTPVYKAYCAAVVKKDDAAIRKYYSADTLKSFEEQMKEDNIKSLSKFLEIDQVSNELCEVRNEQFSGDAAVAEIRTKGYPNGIKVVWIKENGEWKMTNRRPEGALK